MIKEQILRILPVNYRDYFERVSDSYDGMNEIRIRINRPVIYLCGETETVTPIIAKAGDVNEVMDYISNYSVYAHEDEIRNGFITVEGGHRVGICGRAVAEKDGIRTIRNISFINIRIAHEIVGCSDLIIDSIFDREGPKHTMIIAPPGYGKTTLLRDVIRNISDGTTLHKGVNVSVVDERSEIAACHLGVPQNNLGIRTDVMDCCPKAQGMLCMIRTMAPKVVAVDEIGSREDIEALMYIINCGSKIICTVHGNSFDEVAARPYISEFINANLIEKYLIIKKDRKIVCM